ncbi:hypothetical protein MAM1_0267d08961 [Mucor ambiguus]|uniref:Uncharacterized protein n=1 Tax=Mucor ambiguus TaxID=91626 RepID=A0A0C9MPP8_9FUNG|nr:hypothetical protein MAM1_0267d08961 [Mucor ambiguus]
MAVQWVYANGSTWVTLDLSAQYQIESLWSRDASSWINSDSFRGPVYVDTSEMVLMFGGLSYVICRR